VRSSALIPLEGKDRWGKLSDLGIACPQGAIGWRRRTAIAHTSRHAWRKGRPSRKGNVRGTRKNIAKVSDPKRGQGRRIGRLLKNVTWKKVGRHSGSAPHSQNQESRREDVKKDGWVKGNTCLGLYKKLG